MKVSRVLAAAVFAATVGTPVFGEIKANNVGEYLPIEGFFGETLPANWQPIEGSEPVRMELTERIYPVAITETNDVPAANAALKAELLKYYSPDDVDSLLKLIGDKVLAAAADRANLNMPASEVVASEVPAAVALSMRDFYEYKSDVLARAGFHNAVYIGNVEEDKPKFQALSIGDMFDFINFVQVPVKRNTLLVIAPVGGRAQLLFSEYIPVKVSEKFELSARLFSSANPTEDEVRARAGMPSTLDVETQVLNKKLGGFLVIFYDKDLKEISTRVKLYATEDYQRKRVVWNFDIPRFRDRVPAFIRVGLVVAPANAADPDGDPVEFSDVRLRYTNEPLDAWK